MRVQLNRGVCSGHGRCYVLAPDVFDADDDGYGVPRFEVVPPELEAQALVGATNCPEDAISIITD